MVFAFGPFELDVSTCELRRNGRVVPLQPRVFSTLRYLVEHRDRVVSQRELIEALWHGQQLSGIAVPWSVSHARRALGQRAGHQRFIETVTRRGYRFVAPVRITASRSSCTDELLRIWRTSTTNTDEAPLLGRDEIMGQLVHALDCSRSGQGSLWLLTGEAGIGKTRCAAELAGVARANGATVWSARCSDTHMAPAFWPWIQLLREGCKDAAADPDERQAAEALLQRLVPSSSPAHARKADAPAAAPDGAERFWLLDSLCRWLKATARSRPRVIVLDDLHWADDGSLDALGLLAHELAGSTMLVIATAREAADADAPCETALESRLRPCERRALTALSLTDVARYLEVAIGEPPSPQLSSAVHAKTAGNPLFVREAVRLVGDRRSKSQPVGPEDVRLPAVAKGLLGDRIAALDGATREVLEAACVIGEEFELSLLQKVTALASDELLARLEVARRARILEPRPDMQRPGFTHGLMREALYESLSAAECVRLHARVGLAIETLAPIEPRLRELAYHFHHALPDAQHERAMRYGKLAGDAAMRVFAYEEAAELYAWALAAQPYVAGAGARTAGNLLLAGAAALLGAGRRSECRKRCAQAIDLARSESDPELLVGAARLLRPSVSFAQRPDPLAVSALQDALALLPEQARIARAQIYARLACLPPYASSLADSRRLSELGVQLARDAGDRLLLLETLCSRFHALSGPDSLAELLRVADEVLHRNARSASWPAAQAHVARYHALLQRGELPAADDALEAFGRVVGALRIDASIWQFDRLRAQARFHAGELAAAEGLFEALWERGRRMRLPYAGVFYTLQRDALHVERTGRAPDEPPVPGAREGLLEAFAGSRTAAISSALGRGDLARARADLAVLRSHAFACVVRDRSYLFTLAQLASAAIELGEQEAAAELYDLLRPYAEFNLVSSASLCLGSASQVLGTLARVRGLRDDAIAHFEAALAMNTRIGYRPAALHSRFALAALLAESASSSERAGARELAREVARDAQEVSMFALAQRAARFATAGRSR